MFGTRERDGNVLKQRSKSLENVQMKCEAFNGRHLSEWLCFAINIVEKAWLRLRQRTMKGSFLSWRSSFQPEDNKVFLGERVEMHGMIVFSNCRYIYDQ